MEESRNNRAVERRIKDALKNDRARIQVGRISHFGLLEMSRQRIRTGVLEGSTVVCPHCQGAGVVRSTASIALHVLRALEDALIKSSTHDVVVRTRAAVALYILNQKRANLRELERRFGIAITVEADDTLTGANYYGIERGEIATGVKGAAEPPPLEHDDFATSVDEPALFEEGVEEEREPLAEEDETAEAGQRGGEGAAPTEEGEVVRRRRRRRRRRAGERTFGESIAPDAPQPTDDGLAAVAEIGGDLESAVESIDLVDRRGSRSEGGRNGRRSRRSRGPRNQFPAHDEGVHERDASAPHVEPDLDCGPTRQPSWTRRPRPRMRLKGAEPSRSRRRWKDRNFHKAGVKNSNPLRRPQPSRPPQLRRRRSHLRLPRRKHRGLPRRRNGRRVLSRRLRLKSRLGPGAADGGSAHAQALSATDSGRTLALMDRRCLSIRATSLLSWPPFPQ